MPAENGRGLPFRMPGICYMVTATIPDAGLAERYLQWLQGGHVQAVISAGAASASILHFRSNDSPASDRPITVISRYTFASQTDLDHYEREAAPALRAEGARLFGGAGISFQRQTGRVVAEYAGEGF